MLPTNLSSSVTNKYRTNKYVTDIRQGTILILSLSNSDVLNIDNSEILPISNSVMADTPSKNRDSTIPKGKENNLLVSVSERNVRKN